MSVKEIHKYQEINDFTGKSAGARKHSVSYKDTGGGGGIGVLKTLKVATLVSIVGLGAATAAVQMESPIIDFSGMKTYFAEEPKWQSDGPTFQQLFGDHVHEWDSGTVTVEVTCTTDGTLEFHCKGCDETKTETIPATGHTVVATEGTDPTCTEDGLSAGESCSICGEILKASEIVAATGHVPIEVEEAEATCTEQGHTAGKVCSVCGEGLEDTQVTKALGHKYGKTKTVKKASCTEDGYTEKKCSRCGDVVTETLSATGHTVSAITAKAATCTADGRTEGSKCSTCGEVFTESKVISALGHDPSIPSVISADTLQYPVCLRCGANLCPHEYLGESMIWEDGDSWDATCVEPGHISGTSCAICGKQFTQGYDIPATGQHKLSNEYAIVERANCTSTGKTVYLCEICEGEIEVETPIDSSEHSFTIQITDEEGNITDVRCDRCGASMGAAVEKPSTD